MNNREKSNEILKYLMNGGVCVTTNRSVNCEVFQGANGCFYNRKEDGTEKLYTDFFFNLKKKDNTTEPIFISAEVMQSHFAKIGRPQGKSSFIEKEMTKVSQEHGMILIIKANILPSGAMHEEVDLKGRVLIASSISDNKEMIKQQLIELDMINEFDDSKSKKIIELATDLLSHHGSLDIK